jgi:hypothetical protein
MLVSYAAGFWGSGVEETPISVEVSPDGMIVAPWEEDTTRCDWWDGSFSYSLSTCNSFAVTRLSPTTIGEAIDRANRCASEGTTDCVLAPEIGVALPAAFLYSSAEASMKMLIAPRLLPHDAQSRQRLIRLQDPFGRLPHILFEYNDSLLVEYLVAGGREVKQETLENSSAYCIQSLRRAISESCWKTLD